MDLLQIDGFSAIKFLCPVVQLKSWTWDFKKCDQGHLAFLVGSNWGLKVKFGHLAFY